MLLRGIVGAGVMLELMLEGKLCGPGLLNGSSDSARTHILSVFS